MGARGSKQSRAPGSPGPIDGYSSARRRRTSHSIQQWADAACDRHRLLFFYSGTCSLCKSLQGSVQDIVARNASWLAQVQICCDDQMDWAPEVRPLSRLL